MSTSLWRHEQQDEPSSFQYMITQYNTKFLNMQNNDVVSQKNSVTLQQYENIKHDLACLRSYKHVTSVWNFALKFQAVAPPPKKKTAYNFTGYFLSQTADGG